VIVHVCKLHWTESLHLVENIRYNLVQFISCLVTKSSKVSQTHHPKQTTEHEIKCTKQTSVSKSRDFLVKSLMI